MFKQLTREEFRNYLLTLRNKRVGEGGILMTAAGFQPVASLLRFLHYMTDTVKGVHHQSSPTSSEESPSPALTQTAPQAEVETTCLSTGDEDDLSLIDAPHDYDNSKGSSGGKKSKRGHEPELEAPNDTEIDLILELLDYINDNRANFQSGDLKKITGEQGNNAKAFFEEHARNFRQHHPPAGHSVVPECSSPSAPTTTVHSEGL